MEQLIAKNLETAVSLPSNNLKNLTIARSLLTNTDTSPSSLNSVVETLIRALDRRPQDPTFAGHVIKVLGDAASVHRSLAPSAIQTVRSCLNADDHIAADALAVLDSLGQCFVLCEDVVISLASSSIVSARSMIADILVKNSTLLRPELMLRVFLGLSTDLYPLVRESAANGVAELLERDVRWVDGAIAKRCHDCAVELLRDENELLRAAAARLASECARLFAVTKMQNTNQPSDVIFILFLGALTDISWVIRHTSRKVLWSMKLPSHEMFNSSVDGLITNLVTHPEEEEDIFCVLFFVGKSHGNYTAKRVKEFEMESLRGGAGNDCLEC